MYKSKHLSFPVLLIGLFFLAVPSAVHGDGQLHKLKHIIIVMQENHSFDNYFGALAYDPQSPYHNGNGACSATDHRCVDGLSCAVNADGSLACSNVNLDDDATLVAAYHDPRLCVSPDLDHEWGGSHFEANFAAPNNSLAECLNDGFVRQNDLTLQPDTLTGESAGPPPDDDTMGFYTQDDLPFYYYLAEHFAIDDRYFAPVLGPTAPNRSYLMAATSFGHVSGAEQVIITSLTPPTTQPYQPINGTIFDLLDRYGVSWTDYYSDVPESISFRTQAQVAVQGKLISQFYIDAAAGKLPRVSLVESATGQNPFLPMLESDEIRPPTHAAVRPSLRRW